RETAPRIPGTRAAPFLRKAPLVGCRSGLRVPTKSGCSSATCGGDLVELVLFRRAAQSGGRRFPARDDLSHCIEVTGTDFALMFGRSVTIALCREFRFL